MRNQVKDIVDNNNVYGGEKGFTLCQSLQGTHKAPGSLPGISTKLENRNNTIYNKLKERIGLMKVAEKIAIGICVYGIMLNVCGMPGDEHLRGSGELGGIRDAVNIPAESGGLGSVSSEKARNIHRFMDNEASCPGMKQIQQLKSGPELLRPANHGHCNHNPERVAKIYSGNGTINLETLNSARLHKIQDVARNSAPVDGWEITNKMRNEAKTILKNVKKGQGIPNELPTWVDKSGPLLKNGVAKSQAHIKIAGAMQKGYINPVKRALPLMTRGVAVITVASTALAAGVEISAAEAAYECGDIDYMQKKEAETTALFENSFGTIGAGLGVLGGCTVGSLAMPGAGTVAGSFVGCAAGGSVGGNLGRATADALNNYWREDRIADFKERVNIQSKIAQSHEVITRRTVEDYRRAGFSEEEACAYARQPVVELQDEITNSLEK